MIKKTLEKWKKYYWEKISVEVRAEDIANGKVPEQSLWQFLWRYYDLKRDEKRLAKAIHIAQTASNLDPRHKRMYVFKQLDGTYLIISRNEIEYYKLKGVFKKNMSILDIITHSVWYTPFKEFSPKKK